MRKIALTAILLLSVLHGKAQNIVPVEKSIDYWNAHKGIPAGTYLKDVNNLFSKFIGTWKGTINNKTYTFFITKKTETSYGSSEDQLVIEYLIIDNLLGYAIEDTRITPRPPLTGRFFQKDLAYYILSYSGEYSKCGREGSVYIKKANDNTITLRLVPQPDAHSFYDCPGGKILDQILPTEIPVALIKQ